MNNLWSALAVLGTGGFLGILITNLVNLIRDKNQKEFNLKIALLNRRVTVYPIFISKIRKLILIDPSEKVELKNISEDLYKATEEIMFLTSSEQLKSEVENLNFFTNMGKIMQNDWNGKFLDDGKKINKIQLLMQKELGIK